MESEGRQACMSSKDNRDILEVLKSELDFIEQGGYQRSVRTPWRPTSVFQDSPTCLDLSDPDRTHPCDECPLLGFVPPDRRAAKVPCHHIALTPSGDTLDSAERWADQQELEDIVKNWLRSMIRQIEQERSKRESTPANPSRPVDAQKLKAAEDVLAIRGHKEYGARTRAGPKPKENPDP